MKMRFEGEPYEPSIMYDNGMIWLIIWQLCQIKDNNERAYHSSESRGCLQVCVLLSFITKTKTERRCAAASSEILKGSAMQVTL